MITSRERVRSIFSESPTDRVGFWLGNPTDQTKEIYYNYFGIKSSINNNQIKIDEHGESAIIHTKFTGIEELELALRVNSDFLWYSPELDLQTWQHPEGKPMFDVLGGKQRLSLNDAGIFAECEDVKEVESFNWPNPDYLDFSATIKNVESANEKGVAVAGGMWMPFFHIVSDFFGMDNYFVKMYTDPDVVEAVTEHVMDFYLQANKRCLDAMGDKLDIVFFGNDLGSQRDLLISPQCFDRFVMPYIKKIIDQAKSYNKKVMLHSCGAIGRIIPKLIDAGIDALHPLQARAAGMDAETLAREYKNDLVFVGGIDTQHLLPFGKPEEIKSEVRRIKEVFGERLIVSPSHEALLPNVSIENFLALCEAATE